MKQLLLFIFILIFQHGTSQIVGATWNSTTSGELNGVPFSIVHTISTNLSTVNSNLSGSNYSAAPLSNSQSSITYREGNNMTITFSSPIDNLRLYIVFWRANGGSYTFNATPTILSGTGMAISGNTLTNTQTFSNGILEFSGSLSSLTISHDSSTSSASLQNLALGVDTSTLETSIFEEETNLKIFPNPLPSSDSNLFINLSRNYSLIEVDILDLTGQIIEKSSHNNLNSIELPFKAKSRGIYLVRITIDNESRIIKKVIKR